MATRNAGDDEAAWERACALFGRARRVTCLTGAGVSTGSGIPDFRGPTGLWTTDPDRYRLSDLDSYLADPEVRRRAWRARLTHPAWHAAPNAAHQALVTLERAGRLGAVLTQNIDGLHQEAGLSREKLVELHGTLFATICLDCGATGSMRAALQRVTAGEDDPECRACGGILKSRTISFGQSLDRDVLRAAQRAALDCDLFLAAGTSLTVQPAAALVELAVKAGAALVLCNAEATSYDEVADAVLRSPVDVTLPRLVAAPCTESGGPLRTWADPATWTD